MNTTNTLTTLVETNATVMGQLYAHLFGHGSSTGTRILLIVALSCLVHLTVKAFRQFTEWLIQQSHASKSPFDYVMHQPKFVTFIQLVANAVTFVMYFFAVGLVLEELGINLTHYLASASIVGLAISFGSQGLVQDVVISLTLIFSDTMDVGDMVEIGSSTSNVIGRLEEIGMRFTSVRNYYNQKVCIPNRSIGNVSRYPQGGVLAYADIQLPAGPDRDKAVALIQNVTKGTWVQFGAIILEEPVVGAVEAVPDGGWEFLRVHFKIWPGQGNLIENTFRQQIVSAMKGFQPAYADWQVPVTYRAITASRKTKSHQEPGKSE